MHDNLNGEWIESPFSSANAVERKAWRSWMRTATAWGVMCCVLAGAAVGCGGEMAQAQVSPARNAVVALDHGWQSRQITAGTEQGENGWLPATVPGDVHLDLLANKKIPDPFFRDNESKLQWIEQESWEDQLSFEVTSALLSRANGARSE